MERQQYHAMRAEEAMKRLGTNSVNGLSIEEAKQRQVQDGANEITAQKKKGVLYRFLAQFKDFMILVLLCAAAVSYGVSAWEGEADYADSILILLIVILNAALGVVQETKAERSIEALRRLSAPEAEVVRGGNRMYIPARELACGDLVYLHAGNFVPADIRLLNTTNLRIDESSLTGESKPSKKEANGLAYADSMPGDCKNMAYSMTLVTAGHGSGVVTAIGMNTESGRIAGMIQNSETKETPLQRKLSDVGRFLGIAAMIICAIIFLIGILQGRPALAMFMTAVSLAVAAIPEGLPAIVTIMLSIGVQRMAKKRAIIRRLAAVETLGSASIICSDKTGTLTKNRLSITEYVVPAYGMLPIQTEVPDRAELLTAAVLCSNAEERKESETYGEPTEQAIIAAAGLCRISCVAVRGKYKRIQEIPFDSSRKRMTTIHRNPDGSRFIIIKGAFDYLLPMCNFYYKNGTEVPLDKQMKAHLIELHQSMAEQALRVLAVIRKNRLMPGEDGNEEREFTFLGLLGMLDPPREESMEAVATCKAAGIRPVMVTGDHAITAAAIAKKLGILTSNRVITGAELQQMSDLQLKSEVKRCSVFARVSPEHKLRIVNAFHANGEIVAMTGDGINDAPALKNADIGCAMGKSGTDVAKSAADMILTDDNFATIVEAVREGRSIYDNIRRSVHFLLSSNIGEILTILVAILIGLPSPLSAVQLLWVNLVTDSLPAIALGVEPPARSVMRRPPVSPKKGIFADGMVASILFEGVMIGMLALIAYAIGGQTMAFMVLSISQLVHAFNIRSSGSVFKLGLLTNRRMNLAFVVGILLQTVVIMIKPLNIMFHTAPMGIAQWGITALLSLLPLVIVELQKQVNGQNKE